jgi:penicillin amidase
MAVHDEGTLAAIQLDDRALFLERWQALLLEVLVADRAHPLWREARAQVEGWGGRAAIDSVGYRLVRAFRNEVTKRVLEPLTRPCSEADERFTYRALGQTEGPVWQLLGERPAHLLDPGYTRWNELLEAAVEAVLDELTADGRPLAECTWGARNTTAIRHPLSRSLPLVGSLLDMAPRPLPGDGNMPRVQGRTFGASQRMVVSPGREAEGLLHMPCGQSGHPMSPYYRAGHADWEEGRPTSFLPGPSVYELRLLPPEGVTP